MSFSNPFDDAQGQFYVLQNTRQQYSLWPQQCPLPPGWVIVCEPQPTEDCHAWLTTHWNTLTPAHFTGGRHE